MTYVFCVMTKNQEDRSFLQSNDGVKLIEQISSLFWKNFEPDSVWEAAKQVRFYRY